MRLMATKRMGWYVQCAMEAGLELWASEGAGVCQCALGRSIRVETRHLRRLHENDVETLLHNTFQQLLENEIHRLVCCSIEGQGCRGRF